MNIKNHSWNSEELGNERIKENKTKLQLFNKINELNLGNQHQDSTFLLLKIINVLFLKKILTSKVTNRLTQQYFKNFTIGSKKNLEKKQFSNPGFFDTTYRNTLFLNSIYELITSAE